MLQLRCPLGHVLEIGTEHLGQRLMCPLCQAVVHAIPPRVGEPPTAKYEVQCSKGHILRVKQKYLGKEVRCPSCQQLVSMKAQNLLTSSGKVLAETQPDAFKKKAAGKKDAAPAPKKPTPKVQSPPTLKNASLKPKVPSSRIPPPPIADSGSGTDDAPPLPPELVEDESFELDSQVAAVEPGSPPTVSDEDFEFEVVDTQFHMELGESGVEAPKAAPVMKTPKAKKPAPPQQPPPVRRPSPVSLSEPPAKPSSGPLTGLHTLSDSEMMKVPHAALQQAAAKTAQFECPNGHLLEMEEQYRGMHIQCPLCKVVFELPK